MAAPGVFYTVATDRLNAQMQQIDQLDAKIATIYSVASVILAFFAGLLTIATLPSNRGIRITDFVLLGLAILVYAVLAVFLLKAYRVRDWSLRPNLPTLQAHCAEYTEDGMQEWVADECVRSIEVNKPKIVQKGEWLNNALFALAAEAGLIALAGAITLLVK